MTRMIFFLKQVRPQHGNKRVGQFPTRNAEDYSGVWAGVLAPSPAPSPSGASGDGVILRNCLFMERSRKTSATPIAATTRKPSTPVPILSLDEAATAARAPRVKGSLSPRYR